MNTKSESANSVGADTRVAEIMTRSVHTVTINDTVAEAVKLMTEKFGTIPVTDGAGKCVGMLSHADLTEELLNEDRELARIVNSGEGAFSRLVNSMVETCDDRLVREFMSDDLVTANESTTIQEVCTMMADRSIHHVPIVNESGMVAGIVSTLDIIKWLAG